MLDRWDAHVGLRPPEPGRDLTAFRRLTRDIYIAAGDHGFWQGAIRNRADPMVQAPSDAVADEQPVVIDLLYGDHDGARPTISRFSLLPRPEGQRISAVSRHWNLDRSDPR